MLDFYDRVKPISYEMDAYGDFLKMLGTKNKAGALLEMGGCGDIQSSIHEVLRSSDLQIVVLPSSRFYHLGTTTEYIENLCSSVPFMSELGTSRFVLSKFTSSGMEPDISSGVRGVIMHSLLHPSSDIGSEVVLEHCRFDIPVKIEEKCILSNCRLDRGTLGSVDVPSNSVIFTVSVNTPKLSGYVTVAFGVFDELKFYCGDKKELLYFNQKLRDLEMHKVLNLSTVFPEEAAAYSLWEARLFAVKPTMSDSFLSTLQLVSDIEKPKNNNEATDDGPRMSMKDILKWKDIQTIINYQNSIFD